MPRIEDRLLKSVIYLYKSKEDAERGAPGGSGFLVGEQCAIPEAAFLFAVTNAHVARSCPVMRTAGRAADKRVIVRKENDWYHHPDQDDVVANWVCTERRSRLLSGLRSAGMVRNTRKL
jgi:hypothetical protein